MTETQHGPNDSFHSAVKHLIHYPDADLGKELDCILRYDEDPIEEASKAIQGRQIHLWLVSSYLAHSH